MGLSEEEVFEILTADLESKGYEFVVHCDYASIKSQYPEHRILLSGAIPDILALSPEKEVIAIEVKGDRDIKKGKGQAITYLEEAQVSYLAADEESLSSETERLHHQGVGTISVSSTGEVEWSDASPTRNLSGVLEIRSQLRCRLQGRDRIEKIVGLNLAHPLNFLAPALFLANYAPSRPPILATFKEELAESYDFGQSAIENSITGAKVLGLIEVNSEVSLTDSGRLGVSVLRANGHKTLEDLKKLKSNSSNQNTLFSIEPDVGLWLQQQYRLYPEFNALYEVIQDFDPGESVDIREIARVLIREHPNVFLSLFCTQGEESREYARELILEGNAEKILTDLDVFRSVIRQNIVHNFKRQLSHIGVLDRDSRSTTEELDKFDPEDYPWIPAREERNARLTSFT